MALNPLFAAVASYEACQVRLEDGEALWPQGLGRPGAG